MQYTYIPSGTCSRRIDFEIDNDGNVRNISFVGGCNGNLKGICALSDGKKAENIIETLEGITCGNKGTSCPDQLARALKEALNEQQ